MLPDFAHQTSLSSLLAIISLNMIDGEEIRKLIETLQQNTSFHGKLFSHIQINILDVKDHLKCIWKSIK